jgi:hypothetical protein
MYIMIRLICYFPVFVSALEVFDFGPARHSAPGAGLSSAVLSSAQTDRLPDRFILCSSTKQGKVDNKSPFLLYGQDDIPWLAFSHWLADDGSYLWVDIRHGRFWGKLHAIENPLTHVWRHICADIDTTTGTLIVSLNGRTSLNMTTKYLRENKPDYLKGKLEIGLTKNVDDNVKAGTKLWRQFFGFVTNINIFHYDDTKSVEKMSLNPCSNVGDYMAWDKADFDWKGINMTTLDIAPESICEIMPETYNVLLPTEMTRLEAKQGCNILGGNMSKIIDENDLHNKVTWVKAEMSSCAILWTPFTDETKEGVYTNSNDGTIEHFLPWKEGQPNGGSSQNFVGAYLEHEHYGDWSANHRFCVSCDLHKETTFRMRGLCKSSYLGESIWKLYHFVLPFSR